MSSRVRSNGRRDPEVRVRLNRWMEQTYKLAGGDPGVKGGHHDDVFSSSDRAR